jgi:DNA-directed RNA polymerase subunit M/transcription elongation factor TFIIS
MRREEEMDCIIKCPECRKSIFFTKDGILKKREEKKINSKGNNILRNDNNARGHILMLNENKIKCPICKNKVISLTQYCNTSGYDFNKNNDKNNNINDKLLMEAKIINKILQLFEIKIKIIEPKNIGNYNCDKKSLISN